jgi:hypothetical protein
LQQELPIAVENKPLFTELAQQNVLLEPAISSFRHADLRLILASRTEADSDGASLPLFDQKLFDYLQADSVLDDLSLELVWNGLS